MPHATITGMTAYGVFTGDPVHLIADGIPHSDAPPLETQDVDDAAITKLTSATGVHTREWSGQSVLR